MSGFTHLHVHSQYSLLNSSLRVADYVSRAKEMGMTAIAMTDEGNMFGAVDFYKRAKKAGLKLILGVHLAVEDPAATTAKDPSSHLVLLSRDGTGYANLRELVSMAWMDGLQDGVPHANLSLLEKYSEGVIALSGSTGNDIARAVLDGRIEDAKSLVGQYRRIFGDENFYLQVMPTETDQLVAGQSGLPNDR